MSEPKATLHDYLRVARETMLWKLEGLSDYDVRRPMTRTGTNLLGMVKHLAYVEFGYFGEVFGRSPGVTYPWQVENAGPNCDFWATADESREDIVELYQRAWAHSDATIEELDLDATGHVPWWGDGGESVTLHQILVHVATETHRHAGHADIVRELIDGAVGFAPGDENVEPVPEGWEAYRAKLERVARETQPISKTVPDVGSTSANEGSTAPAS